MEERKARAGGKRRAATITGGERKADALQMSDRTARVYTLTAVHALKTMKPQPIMALILA